MLSFLLEVSEKIGIAILARRITDIVAKLDFHTFPTLATHNKELTAALSKMPFIYKDLTTMVLKDFVQVDMEIVDPELLTSTRGNVIKLSTDERLKTRRKALFVGSAGIGKTTFFRYTVLSLITKSEKADHFFPKEPLVPFYVPLKAVDNTKPLPVLNYLQQSTKYLRGNRGMRRLGRLAKQWRLFLLLDGYDEIYVPPQGQQNFLLEELNVLMADQPPSEITSDPLEIKAYSAMKNCRAWLSTRREFYALHPLDIKHQRERMSGPLGVVAISISGLHNRSLLVNKIFDIYRSRDDFYHKLSEEDFLQDIDLRGDDDLIALSFSPLFLTVLCYIHIQSLTTEDGNNYRQFNMSQLISTCIDLLLEDLDLYRVRDLPDWQRELLREVTKRKMEKRRFLYTTAKKEFLAFFASRLLSLNLPVFSEAMIEDAAREFLRTEYRGNDAEEILRGIGARHRSEHSFVRQLLNQGVFVLVPKTGDTLLYDFPHRRFREVLAARYLNTEEGKEEVINNLDNPQYEEFVYVFFSVSLFQNEILRAALDGSTLPADRGMHFGNLAYNCLKVKPSGYDPSPILLAFIEQRLADRLPFQAPLEILDYLFLDKDTIRRLAQQLRTAINMGDKHVLAIVGPTLLTANRALLADILANGFDKAISIESRSCWSLFMSLVAKCDSDILFERAPQCKGNLQLFRAWAQACISIDGAIQAGKFVRAAVAGLKFDRKVILVDVIQENGSGLLTRFDQASKIYDELEILSLLIRSIRHPELMRKREHTAVLELKRNGFIHVITRAVLLLVDDLSVRERVRNLTGQVLATADLDEARLTKKFRERVIRRSRHSRHLWNKVGEVLQRQSKDSIDAKEYFYSL